MTPQEKAKELSDNFSGCLIKSSNFYIDNGFLEEQAKQCALIACDRIIEGVERAFDEYEKATGVYVKNRIFYWDFYSDIKGEIKKL